MRFLSLRRWMEIAPAISLWVVFGGAAMVTGMPDKPFHLSPSSHALLKTLIPEGWAFFTRDPRELDVLVYRWTSRGYRPSAPIDVRGFAIGGLSRKSRIVGMEIEALMREIPDSAWQPCPAPEPPCVPHHPVDLTINHPLRVRTLCAQILLVRAEPVPWAWQDGFDTLHRARDAAVIHVQCDEDQETYRSE